MRRRTVLAGAGVLVLSACRAPSSHRAATPASRSPSPMVSPSPVPSRAPLPRISGRAPATSFQVRAHQLAFRRGARKLPTLVYAPTATGRFPVVVFGHGLTGEPSDYAALLSRWAAAGFVVAAPAFPDTNRFTKHFSILDVPNQPSDLSTVLTELIDLPAGHELRRRLDPLRAAVAGHSAGAITALGVLTDDGPGGRDDRFIAGVVLAGNLLGVGETFSDPPVPVLFVHARHDPVVPYPTGKAAFDGLTWPKALLTLSGNEHSEPYVDPRDAHFAAVRSATTDFLRGALYGDPSAFTRLRRMRDVTTTGQL